MFKSGLALDDESHDDASDDLGPDELKDIGIAEGAQILESEAGEDTPESDEDEEGMSCKLEVQELWRGGGG